ncbi:[Pyruvate dehydrogenase [acetyl-transferring]]-phosphatase 1, mitochondrial [Coniosporium tulheliwenetii]|uniref:[Pyruvate dehydrogenase [acetyl-transferring]]-phosphatase 1, mitochondrial n=1 Tax=Coniosporium tulheliwenetii TaxID=3383036 RepID=A0ACC2Z4L4_9PEZI|nr:[Pyruvate dehydrogenase [acetyl-transferring]]-phosphatase 1, mitochondrial [Cladosporium sp. JES 115]
MRRTALQTLRPFRRPSFRKFIRTRNLTPSSYALGLRFLTSRRAERITPVLTSSMHIRNFSYALISAAVASGAWYTYRGTPSAAGQSASPTAEQGFTSAGVYSAAAGAAPSSLSAEAAAESTRRALVVEQGQLYTGTITGEGPLSKETDDYGRKVLEMMTPEQATERLRKNEESWLVGRGRGVVRYDVVQIPSNDPIEDDHAEKIVEVPGSAGIEKDRGSDWMFWGVFDGHSGWITSARLRQALISFVARELNTTYAASTNPALATIPSPESIDKAIKQGFIKLDYEICHESVNKVNAAKSKRVAAELLAPALSGSCALLSFYDSRSKLLRVACTGDSRAVLGRRGASGKWTATALSVDQTGGNEEEAERMRKEHPGEPNVVMNGRVLGGLEPTRAFGDAIYKWSLETQEKIRKHYFGRSASRLMRTPPYVTAEPVITTTKVEPEKGDFVVMATDGLWEMLTNEEVVGLVAEWLEHQSKLPSKSFASASGSPTSHASSMSQGWLKSWFSQQKGMTLPVEHHEGEDKGGQRAPIRQQQWGVTAKESERFVVEDSNAATHLVRNALGGKDRDQVCALLTLPSPYSRRYRDDLTVEVIFFGEGENTGTVTLNTEASASGGEFKAKL